MTRPRPRPQPISRRSRPAKPPLSRDTIVKSALGLLRRDEEKPLTLRRLATELDTGAASLYVYFDNTADLNAAVLDDLLGTVELARGTSHWRERLICLLIDYTAVLYDHPTLASTALVTRPSGTNTLRAWEAMLALLTEGGVDIAQSAWGVDMLIQRATATALEASNANDLNPTPGHDDRMVDAFVHSLPAADHPHLARAAAELFSGTPAARMTWGFEVLINGIAATRQPDRQAQEDRHGNVPDDDTAVGHRP